MSNSKPSSADRSSKKRWRTTTSEIVENLVGGDISCTSAAADALWRCHESFLHHLAAELSNKDEKRMRTGVAHVEAALKRLGMEAVARRAVLTLESSERQSDKQKNLQKRKGQSKKHSWSQDQIDEQERLLAASKHKLFEGA
jgi:hypothetical protein